jgi:hypothetical protein
LAATLGTEQQPVAPAQTVVAAASERDQAPAAAFARDWRIDVIRGFAAIFVVVGHTRLESPLLWTMQGRIGFNSPAEWFVVISGLVVALMARPAIERFGLALPLKVMLRKARELYVAALAVGVAVLGLRQLPLGTEAVTFDWWGDLGSVDLYAHDGALDLVTGLLTMRIGPWPVNVLGLYIVLVVVAAPVCLYALDRWGGRAVVPLAVASFALYALSLGGMTTGLPSQFDVPFHSLSWQLLFVAGLIAGWFWADLRDRFMALPHRRLLELGVVVAAVGFALHRQFGPGVLSQFTVPHSGRPLVEPVRLVNVFVMLAAMYVVLSRLRALERPTRFLFEGFGRNSLYVFVLHAFMLIAVATALGVESHHGWAVNLAVQAAALVLFWTLVRRRVLFGIVPR